MKATKAAAAYPIFKFELSLYFLTWISHSITAIFLSWNASNKVKLWLLIQHFIVPSSYVNAQFIDLSDWEWIIYREMFVKLCFFLAANSIISRLIHRLLHEDSDIRSIASIVLYFILQCTLVSPYCVIVILCSATTIILLVVLTRMHFFGWTFALIILLSTYHQWAPFSSTMDDKTQRYCEMIMYSYCTLKIVSISTFLARNDGKKLGIKIFLEFYEYLLYLPYSMHYITQFEDFRVQNQQKFKHYYNNTSEYCAMAKIFVKLAFFFFTLEALLHFCYANALFNGPLEIYSRLNNYEVASIAYIAGHLFHMKYTVIFGLLNAFAHLDGLIPFQPLICCPSRLTKYSQLWRRFDKGLYKFVKLELYIPLMVQPMPFLAINSSFRKIFALIAVYMFVLLWHDFQWKHVYWISLSVLELCIERIAFRYIGPSEFWQKNVVEKLSVAGYVRLNAVLLLGTVTSGMFGVFFFLANNDIGSYILQHILIDGVDQLITLNVHSGNAAFVGLHLLLLGYTFNHCCLYIEWRENLQPPA